MASIFCHGLNGSHAGSTVYLPRIDIHHKDPNLPFEMVRCQFPVQLAFAMTINKSQSQSMERVGIWLDEPVFGHGQLYVALSRSCNPDHVCLHLGEVPNRQGQIDGKWYTVNIVYHGL